MPSHPRFNGLPVEVMEGIVTLLELRDICNLRLTAAEVAAKSSQGRFRTHFHTKTIKLTAPEQLDEFVHMTRPKQLGCLVQHLTLVGGLPTSPLPNQEPSEQEHGPAGPLGQSMENLRLNSARGAVRSVSLVVEGAEVPGGGRPWQSVWDAAAECFETTALALGASRLRIEEAFDVFGRVPRCSLACDRLAPVLEQVDLAASLQGVKQLSMSLSHHRVHKNEPESEEMRSLACGERNTAAIARFLGLCTQLEELQLHWFNLREANLTDALLEEQRFFTRIAAASCRFPALKRCSLKGIYTSGPALLSFLRRLRLSSLEMEEVHLHAGTFRPVFKFLAAHMECLECLRVDDLWEKELIFFDAPGNPPFPMSGGSVGPSTLTRTGADARRLVQYRFGRGYVLGSAEAANWDRQKILLYGPPR